jgi:O-antigen/teichoic acid export membrane protein
LGYISSISIRAGRLLNLSKFYRLLNSIGLEKGLAYVSLGNAVYIALSAILWLYLASQLDPTAYGEINYEVSVVTILTSIGIMGFDTTIPALVARGTLKVEQESISLILLSAVTISTILVVIFNSISMAVLLTGMLFFTWVSVDYLGRHEFKNYMIIMALQRGLSLASVPLLYSVFSIDGAIYGWGISYLVLSAPFFKMIKKFTLTFFTVVKIKSYFIHAYLLGIAKALPYFIDKVIIMPLFGASTVGYYQLGIQISMVTYIIPVVLYSYLLPKQAAGNEDLAKVKWLGIFASIFLTLLLFFTLPYIIVNYFPNFEAGLTAARITVFSSIPISISSIYNSNFMAKGESRPVVIGIGIFVSIQFFLIIYLGNIFYLSGISLATVIASSAQCFYLYRRGSLEPKLTDDGYERK